MRLTKLKRAGFRMLNGWPGILWRLRGRRPDLAGEEIGDSTVVAISCRQRRLYLYEQGALTASYRVGIGDIRARTPTGRFSVEALLRDPTWHVPDVAVRFGSLAGAAIAAGDPRNRLGARWIGLRGGFGIHGGPVGPLGIGSTASCVKMRDADVIELFDRLQLGTPVVIR